MNCKQLTETERYQIYSLKKAEHAQREIAKLIGRSASTNKAGSRNEIAASAITRQNKHIGCALIVAI